MSHQDFKLAQDIQSAFMSIGHSAINADFACKLLAYTYVMGGGNKAVVLNPAMNAGIGMATQLLNLKGGEIPNADLLPNLQQRIAELEEDMENTAWLPEIGERYHLTIKYGTYVKPVKKPNDKENRK